MDDLRGPTIQIVLHVKEGLGFGFLKFPFIVSGSLNGYILETDPTVPTHAPVFDAELVWEADKRRFRSLRVQNVPVKIEVYTTSTQGKKDKVGYLLLSLLGAQPCPTNKMVEVKHSWHKLLGVKSEGKCCHPQLLMSLSVEDRVNTLTPRNELRMFHSNEVAYPTSRMNTDTTGPVPLTLDEYLRESKRTISHPYLQPQLICEEGLIQIGDGKDLFVLAIVIGSIENLDSLLPLDSINKVPDCYLTYTVFTHTIMTDRFHSRLRCFMTYMTTLKITRYNLIPGVCSMDVAKLAPTDDLQTFIDNFCTNNTLTVQERCFFVRSDDVIINNSKRPYMDVEMSLKYVGVSASKKPLLTAKSATQLKIDKDVATDILDFKSGSCTDLGEDMGGVAYTNMTPSNTASRRAVLEERLSRGVEQCRRLAEDLNAATEDFRLRGYRNSEREKKLLDAKKALEAHYTSKYQELREASQKMEDDMNHRLKMKDMEIEELQHRVHVLEKQKEGIENAERDAESKYSGLTKDQTASLIQELRHLEEKLDSAVQSKCFFKEQWGRAVRELHTIKINTRRQMLHTLRDERRRLGESLDPIEDQETVQTQSPLDINRLKDDFYVDILANTPALESHSIMSQDGLEIFDELKNLPKNNTSDKLGALISERDELIQQTSPDEERLKQLNSEIRSMLVNCTT
ncbi:putative coiled-coil domain containing 100 [Danaus plexippus plexippus]|uniref:Coiled-coil domain containing 100 n=1 Tax=Danaus plexippus plexippus TaxID=278856 RepID=A0A212FFR2_DANPL|nr:putative coiled-coil domain containing 100 [Danaus plexippus plexippus]